MALVDYTGAKLKVTLDTDGELSVSLTAFGEYGRGDNRRSASAAVPVDVDDDLRAALEELLLEHAENCEEAGMGAAAEALAVARAKGEAI